MGRIGRFFIFTPKILSVMLRWSLVFIGEKIIANVSTLMWRTTFGLCSLRSLSLLKCTHLLCSKLLVLLHGVNYLRILRVFIRNILFLAFYSTGGVCKTAVKDEQLCCMATCSSVFQLQLDTLSIIK